MGGDDVFYDLGSGLGRVVLQAHIQWGVAKSVGVELSAERCVKAERAKQRLGAALDPSRPVHFLNENLLECDFSDATCVYVCCTCWDADFVAKTLDVLEARAPKLRWVVCAESLEKKYGLSPPWLRLHSEERVGQTWAPEGYPVYIYTRAS